MRVLVALAEGVEEIEAVIVIDVLRRAGLEVVAAALGTTPEVQASRGVRLVADTLWSQLQPTGFDLLVLPGGSGGMQRLRATPSVLQAVRDLLAAGKPVAAICAAPLVLEAAGVLAGKRATCYPSLQNELRSAHVVNEPVVEDGLVITSQGPGTTFAFALRLIERLLGKPAADRVAAGLLLTA